MGRVMCENDRILLKKSKVEELPKISPKSRLFDVFRGCKACRIDMGSRWSI